MLALARGDWVFDFHRARVDMLSIDLQKPGPGGRATGPSGCLLDIRPHDMRARRIRLRGFDAGASLLPAAGGSTGDLAHFPPVEFDVGALRD